MAEDYSTAEKAKDALAGPIAVARRALAADDLLHHGSILAGATVLSGGLDYLFQLFLGRALGPEQYGVFGALFAVFYLVGVLGSGIEFSVTRFTAEREASDEALAALHVGLFVRAFLLGVVICGLLVLASPAVGEFLGLANDWPVTFVALTIPFSFGLMTTTGSFQGRQWFALLGSYNVFDAGLKLLAAVALVLLGYGIFGAFAAMLVAVVCSVVVMTLHLHLRLPAPATAFRAHQFDYGAVYRYVSPAVLAGFCLTVPANVDVIVVKHAFTSAEAGLYTAASVLGKILVFLPMGISGALFPKVTDGNTTPGSNRLEGLFDRAMLYSAAVAGAGALVFWFAPSFVLETFYGAAYVDAAPLLRWYGAAVPAFVLAVVVLNFELARDRMRFVYVFAAVTLAEIGLMWLVSASMVAIIQVILVANLGLLGYGIARVKT